jgi:hypothetical protein
MDEIVSVEKVRDERGRILPGVRLAGIRKGSFQRLTRLVKDEVSRAIEAGELVHPLLALLKIANDSNTPVNLRIKANAEALPYLMPQKHQIDVEPGDPADEAEIQSTKRRLQVLFTEEITNVTQLPG